MKRFIFAVITQVEVEAPDLSDAREFIEDTFGNGQVGALEVISHEIVDEEELNVE